MRASVVPSQAKLWAKGFPVGPGSGLNFATAQRVADEFNTDKNVLTVYPDRMECYFTHKVFVTIRISSLPN